MLLLHHHHHHHLLRRFMSALSMSTIEAQIKDLVSGGQHDQALQLFKQQLHPSALHASTSILPSVIKACSLPRSHHFGLQLHCLVIKTGSHSEIVVSNSIISMYAKSSTVEAARKVFDTMPYRDTITWNSLINCHIQNGYPGKALEMLKMMCFYGFVPKPELLACIVSACARTRQFRVGRVVHALVTTDGRIEESTLLSTALVDMYLRSNDSIMGLHVFNQMADKNEVSWTAMISGCTSNYCYKMAIDCLRSMQIERVRPNRVTLIAILPVCAELGSIKQGKEIHGYSFRHGFHWDHHLSASLMHMYCKCGGALRSAKFIFESSTVKDVVMWSSIIGSYAQQGDGTQAMKLFKQMHAEGTKPNSVTLLAIISACTSLSSLSLGYGVHGYAMKSGFDFDIFIGNALINLYAKCGSLEASHQTFKEMPKKDFISWSTLIGGYGLHGCGGEALKLFHEMQEKGMEPDGITFLAVLSACNHAGLVEEGQRIFYDVMKGDKVPPTIELYACHIDLLGRSGKLEDACNVLRTIPMKPSTRIWSSLISACKVHGRLEIAEMIAHQLIKSEPENAANYTLLSMVYAETGNWLGVEEVRRIMRLQGLKKSHGFSQIELDNRGFLEG
ncbi:pentatricopeptide repeat-containing protein At4g31070, mitochondrial [Ziziphus jujuba]|uniref:Pentatricopeptide repeat-containing protein At4g31070, mitochondrial n=1 Tax=Ziziphus jujuba TaxID=326968 RepID=A0ABM3IJI3_ZIZJJ|nr:pentatricopeptide repeat-containing protein At4g31070, mitochondrial [Ziziphus jujuba]